MTNNRTKIDKNEITSLSQKATDKKSSEDSILVAKINPNAPYMRNFERLRLTGESSGNLGPNNNPSTFKTKDVQIHLVEDQARIRGQEIIRPTSKYIHKKVNNLISLHPLDVSFR